MMAFVIVFLCVTCLAYANGANDNFKGVATLFGSGTTNYRGALIWATLTTLLGSLTAVLLAGKLLKNFSGRGLVSNELVTNPEFVAAVALGAGLTVLIATFIGMPISTTHSLIGALVGAGWAAGSALNMHKLAIDFFLPLLLSPILAIVVTGLVYVGFHAARRVVGVTEETCFCAGTEVLEIVPAVHGAAALQRVEQLTATVGNTVTCRNRYAGHLLGIDVGTVLDGLHYLSAGIVGFARGLNDTPKIAGLLLLVPVLSGFGGTAFAGMVIAIGGLVSARRVAEVMSRQITPLNHGQGFSANLITGIIVIGASRLGLPVSTTHVSCGALFGIGAATRQARWATIGRILGAWLTTLPLGAALGAAGFRIISQF